MVKTALVDGIKALSEDYFNKVVEWRRHLHKNPELSFEEFKTRQFLAQQLQEMGIPFQKGIASTGIVAEIKGKNPAKKTIALRADMDALPITEANDISYKSINTGVMHACGHDAHTSSLLGAASIISQYKEQFEGTVRLIFQPGEEKLPGGASLMIKEGVLSNPQPAAIVGQHVMPYLDCGKVGFRSGKYMASSDELSFVVRGKGGHAAAPHLANDTVLAMSQIIVALQQIVSRNSNPIMPSVLSICSVQAGEGAYNVLPTQVNALGTFRTMDEKWRKEAHKLIKSTAIHIGKAYGVDCEATINVGYPVLYNHPATTASARKYASDYLGEENVVDLDLWMAAEDFAFYTQEINGCFYRLGTRNEAKGIISGVHTPTFNIDEQALKIGMGLMSYQAISHLQS